MSNATQTKGRAGAASATLDSDYWREAAAGLGKAPEEDARTLAWRAERAMERLRLIADGETREAAWAWSALKYLEGRMDRDMHAPL